MGERLFDSLIPFLAPIIVIFSFSIVSLWIRRRLPGFLDKRLSFLSNSMRRKLGEITSSASFQWFLIMGIYFAIEISPVKGFLKVVIVKALLCLFIVSLTFVLVRASDLFYYVFPEPKEGVLRALFVARKVFLVVLLLLSLFIIFEILGLSTRPIFFLVIFVVLLFGFILRDEIKSFFAYLHIVNSDLLRKGDYLKIETGEEGTVSDVNLASIKIKTLENKIVFIPPSRLMKMKFEVFRKPLKKADEPFRFYTRLNIKELTGLKARNISEFIDFIKRVPDSVIFYHTHDFVEEYHYLTPQPSNEFALWVTEALGDARLGEKLASIDVFEFSGINEIRRMIVETIEEYLMENENLLGEVCPPGMEFHFIKSVSAIMPTPYIAFDLKELAEILKVVSANSLFFHFYEAKLRLGKLSNDFSIWIKESLGEDELAEKIDALDPYMYSIEGLRVRVIKTIEEYVERRIER